MDEIMTPEELSEYAKRSLKTLEADRLHRRGIPYVKIGRQVRYRRSDIEAYLAANTVRGGE